MLNTKSGFDGLVDLVKGLQSTPEPSTTSINDVMLYIDQHANELAGVPEQREFVDGVLKAVCDILNTKRENMAPFLDAVNHGRLYRDQFDRITRIACAMGIELPKGPYQFRQ